MPPLPLDSLAAWRLDHAWLSDVGLRPIAEDLAIVDDQRTADDGEAGVGLPRPEDDDAAQ